MQAQERLSEHTRRLPPLKVGDHVCIQNQTGPYPLKWDKTGIIVEVRQYDQYMVKTDGSNRITLRNRKFLRHFIPARATPPSRSIIEDLADLRRTSPQQIPALVPDTPSPQALPVTPPPSIISEQPQLDLVLPTNSNQTRPQDIAHDPASIPTPAPATRRSSRISHPPSRLNYQMKGTPSSR